MVLLGQPDQREGGVGQGGLRGWQARFAPESAQMDRSIMATDYGLAIRQAIPG
jgi:hypothetical protein